MSVSTHVLDTCRGVPAEGVSVLLMGVGGDTVAASTDRDGRATLSDGPLDVGAYQLVFATGDYFDRLGTTAFHPQVTVAFRVTDRGAHHHVPLLVSPYSYTTYRGS